MESHSDKGRRSNAIELKVKLLSSKTPFSSSLVSVMGKMAEIALPPHMAVPVEIKCDVAGSTGKDLPGPHPSAVYLRLARMLALVGDCVRRGPVFTSTKLRKSATSPCNVGPFD